MKYLNKIYFWNDKGESLFGKIINHYNETEFPKKGIKYLDENRNIKYWLPTHVGHIVLEEEDRVLIAEAGPKGYLVQGNWYSKSWLDEKIKQGYVKLGETKEKLTNVYENALKYEGIKYSWINIIFHGINLYLKMIGKKPINYTDGIKLLHCSEGESRLIYDSSKKTDFAREYNIPFDDISPAHIFLSKQIKILN